MFTDEIDGVLVAADVLEVGIEFGDAEAEGGFDLFEAAAEDGEERSSNAGSGRARGGERVEAVAESEGVASGFDDRRSWRGKLREGRVELFDQLAPEAVQFTDRDNDAAFEAVVERGKFEIGIAEPAQLCAQGLGRERSLVRRLQRHLGLHRGRRAGTFRFEP